MTITEEKKSEIVETKVGKVKGYVENNITIFKGIPYAEPPIGELRFKSPVEKKPWNSVLDASKFSPCSFQGYTHLEEWFGKLIPESEDCLTLNIWTPGTDNKKRPVMFWVHGGAFIIGGARDPFYDGTHLAHRGDVVVVTINYRLGALGFLFIKEITVNNGLLDQVLALKWVKENIEFFGGDPENITVFGESAGALSVSTYPVMPIAKGLFRRIIVQSVPYFDPSSSEKISKAILRKLGVKKENFEQIQYIPVEKIIEVQNEILGKEMGLTFRPLIDGKIVPCHPIEAFRNGQCKDIDIIIGTNLNEATLFTLVERVLKMSDEEHLKVIFGYFLMNGVEKEKLSSILEMYKSLWNTSNNLDILNAVATDLMFRMYSIDMLSAQVKYGKNAYNYLFMWKSPLFDGKLGSCHALELAFVFGTHENSRIAKFSGSGLKVKQISDKIMDAWISFAHTGNPNHSNIPEWPPYDLEKRSTMILGEECKVREKIQEETRKIWENKLKY
ncbi:MAG: carboxylesterase family protein [Candidatus Lokiarchaeota archaeon]|nr:carboxylesterase family protein [Candidatus Lokiarchaeota archaeon]